MADNQGLEVFSGLQVGLSGLYGATVQEDGTRLAQASARFRKPEQLAEAFDQVVESLCQEASIDKSESLWTLALEKPQRIVLAPRNENLCLVSLKPHIVQPSLSAVLLGAIPSHPGLLVSLGKEVRFALIDSTHTYKEYRVTEGGGTWWQTELQKVSQHSERLRVLLNDFPDSLPPLRHLSRLLELGRYPTPDPALKPHFEKVATRLAEMACTLTQRKPGIRHITFSGFLADSALGHVIKDSIKEQAPHLRHCEARFPPEVGAALSGLAQKKENWERDHLGKELFEQDRSQDDWAPPKELVRRLYRLRKPFERYLS